MRPEAFTRDTFETIPVDGAARAFFRDGKAKSRAAQTVRSIKNDVPDLSCSR
jgi:hypothetical protein